MYWYQKSAGQGYKDAQASVGMVYEMANGVELDYKQAVYWHQKAAEQGDKHSQVRLGEMYLYGRGVEQDLNQAMAYYSKAAKQGHKEAIAKLTELVITPLSTTQQRIDKFIVQDGIATDTETGLTWLRFTYGERWQNDTGLGDIRLVNWKTALDVAMQFNQQGGYMGIMDWRLPNRWELKSLVDMIKGKPDNSIDTDVFPNNQQAYWSSCNAHDDVYNAWCVDFSYEADFCASSGDAERAVRLVRGAFYGKQLDNNYT
jgi:TPR repeat protein